MQFSLTAPLRNEDLLSELGSPTRCSRPYTRSAAMREQLSDEGSIVLSWAAAVQASLDLIQSAAVFAHVTPIRNRQTAWGLRTGLSHTTRLIWRQSPKPSELGRH